MGRMVGHKKDSMWRNILLSSVSGGQSGARIGLIYELGGANAAQQSASANQMTTTRPVPPKTMASFRILHSQGGP